MLAGYWAVLIYHLGAQWSIYDQYNYGWAVPFLCAYLMWKRVGQSGDPSVQSSEFRVQSSRFNVPACYYVLLTLCALLYAPTRWLHEANPIWRLTSWLWALEVIGLTLLALRVTSVEWQVAKHTEHGTRNTEHATNITHAASIITLHVPRFTPALLFFLVAVPWPTGFETSLTQSLKQLDVSVTTELLEVFGIPAVQHGNVIEIRTGMVGVDEACSGIRSFQATLMISLFFCELYQLAVARRAVLCLLGFALAFVFNVGRTLLLVSVASSKGIAAVGSWHDPAGTTILVTCFLCLRILASRLRAKPGAQTKAAATAFPESSPSHRSPASAFASKGPAVLWSRGRVVSTCLLVWLVVVEFGTELWYRSHERAFLSPLSSLPSAEWSVVPASDLPNLDKNPVPPSIAGQFRADDGLQARWQGAAGQNWQLYYFRWLPARSLKKRVSTQMAKTHGPEKCLPRSGMILKSYLGTITIPVAPVSNTALGAAAPAAPFRLAFQQFAFTSDGQLIHVFYGIYEDPSGPSELANRRRDTRNRIAAALAGSRNYGQRFLEIAVWGYDLPEDARAALQTELAKLIRWDLSHM